MSNGTAGIQTACNKTAINKLSHGLGDEKDLQILDVSRSGKGVARDADGRVVFVPLTAPGDRVRIKITEKSKRYAIGEVVQWLERSPTRVEPRCAVFGRCGGCEWQHLPYSLQWKTKLSGLRQTLSRVGLVARQEIEEFPAKTPWGYRNRVQLRAEKGQLGFYAQASHDLVPISRCEIADAKINEVLPRFQKEALGFSRPAKLELEVRPSGELRSSWNAPHASHGFRQVNDEQNENLKAWISAVFPEKIDELIDLYGGDGNLSLGFQGRVSQIHSVDICAPQAAASSANMFFHRSAVLPWLLRYREQLKSRSLSNRIVISDPPREGMGEMLPEVAAVLESLNARHWVLIGCEADAWARDLVLLSRRGWKISRIAAFDFFPQTSHLECAALLVL